MEKSQSKKKTRIAKKVGTPNKGSLRAYAQTFTLEAIDKMADIMRNSRNENLRFAATKLFIDKSLADIRAVEVGGEDHGQLLIRVVNEKNPSFSDNQPPSSGTNGSAEVVVNTRRGFVPPGFSSQAQ